MVSVSMHERERFAWSLVSVSHVSNAPIDLSVRIQFLVVCIPHLSKTEVRSILGFVVPSRLLSDDLVEALELLPVNDPRVSVELQVIDLGLCTDCACVLHL